MKELGFTRSAIDHSMFYRRDGEAHVIVAVATDNMAVMSKCAIDANKTSENFGRSLITNLLNGFWGSK